MQTDGQEDGHAASPSGAFDAAELAFLRSSTELARIATVGADGTPHVTPTGWNYNPELDTIDVRGIDLAQTKKYRDVARNGRVAIVIDDVLPPWHPRAVEVRGRAEAIGGPSPVIRIHPERVVSWGLDRPRPATGQGS
jgi:pyridoxamine 5'-phosphate oxidase family protein